MDIVPSLNKSKFEIEEALKQSDMMALNEAGDIVLDIASLKLLPNKSCSGNKSLTRKGSYRMEKCDVDDQEAEEPPKQLFIKLLPSQLEQLKQPLISNKALIAVPAVLNSPILADSRDGRTKRFQWFKAIHPRKILLFFATMSSIGTMTLIYFTLAINRRGGA
ncbi:hypothetical protein HPP92_020380 [Vanilla planifolia]|uniref:Uncharacterized protein n=1 Tax=Vanilla planifolia TaxID=51239 RepID=A0A835UG81_VANPL|nr:hypothetical protein HPP92_020380 [Vanilla planifolia]